MSASTPSKRANDEPVLFRMLLPNAHTHIPKGKAAMWDRHYQQHVAQLALATKPSRPQTPNRPVSTSPSPCTPRLSLGSPTKSVAKHRCKSAGPSSSRRVRMAETRSPVTVDATTESRVNIAGVNKCDHTIEVATDQQQLNQDARERLELKACMLAHMHRIDVDSLHRLRELAWRELDDIKNKQVVARGGVLDDGSLMETTKRKTSFLLRHFLTLGEPTNTLASAKQDSVLYGVIDEWSCADNASEDEIADLWKSINAHIEQSYVLRRQLIPRSDPNPLSITVAMDCLRKLPAKLPDYRRMLDVIIALIESGLYVPSDTTTDQRDEGTTSRKLLLTNRERKTYYFDEYHRLRDALEHELEEKRVRLAADAQNDAARVQTPRQQLETVLVNLKRVRESGDVSADEMDELFCLFFHADVVRFTPMALREALEVCFNDNTPSRDAQQLFYDTWMPLLQFDDAIEVLVQLTKHHLGAFQAFFHEEFDAMDKLLMEPIQPTTTNARRNSNTISVLATPRRSSRRSSQFTPPTPESPALTLFHELIERHPAQFASVLWASPYLTAHVFQDSQHLIGRILEQNIVLVSQVLQHRPDVLTTLLNYALKDNSIAIEEFLQNHPKAFSDLLLNKGPAVATAIKRYPAILVDVLQASRSTLAKVLLSMPELLCQLFKSTPELLAQTVRDDLTILPLAFSVVPQCLSDALERHPEYFVDVAHRKPALVAKIFAKYPDLLLEPLEANPSVFSNFLVYHRKILPDFSSPTFDPAIFQFERKQYAESGQQTEKRLCKYDGKLRFRERLKFQEDAQVYEIRQALITIASAKLAAGRTTPASSNGPAILGVPSERPSVKDPKAITGALLAPSPRHVVAEIARLYVKKLEVDAKMDALGKKRRVLFDFVLDLYIQELGFKSKAQKKLTYVLAGAKEAEQECLRIKWFLRFMNTGSISTPTVSLSSADASDVLWTYHPLATEFYLIAIQSLTSLPNDQLLKRLEEELTRPCLVGYTRVKQFIDDPIMTRMLPSKDQRHQLLARICETEQLIHGTSNDNTTTTKATVMTLHLEDVLESFMLVWIQYQDSNKSQWATQFQLANPDGSGVIRYNVFADLIGAKLPAMDERAIMKIYHHCGEENDLGEYFIAVDDFSLAMSIIQEQDSIREYAARNTPTATSSS